MFKLTAEHSAKEAKKFLQPGIHNCTFEGVEYNVIDGKNGDSFDVMTMKFNIENFGEYNHNVFAPQNSERKETPWGGTNPSDVETFMTICRHLLDSANPEVAKQIEEGTFELEGKNFKEFVIKLNALATMFIGKATSIKLLPGRNGFASFPAFPVKISKNGNLYLNTRFIGDNLTLDQFELKQIENAKNATPTNMTSKTKNAFDSSDITEDDIDDLPF